MSNDELQAQFARCEQWQDPEQWDLLALAYYQRGYDLNAMHCFRLADALRACVAMETG
jgi:hypothetical protein